LTFYAHILPNLIAFVESRNEVKSIPYMFVCEQVFTNVYKFL